MRSVVRDAASLKVGDQIRYPDTVSGQTLSRIDESRYATSRGRKATQTWACDRSLCRMSRRKRHTMAKKKVKRTADPDAEPLSFEQALARLERIVAQLEEGQLGLDDSLAQYEQGIKYLKQCYRQLERAERKIELLAGVDEQGRMYGATV